MTNQFLTYEYNGKQIQFDITRNDNVMINATQMNNLFDKRMNDFLSSSNTNDFINCCLQIESMRNLKIKDKNDLIYTKQKSGTWMHRVLALKFAAWLNPAFEVWVYTTVDKVLMGDFSDVIEYKKEMNDLLQEKKEIESQKNLNYTKLKDNKYYILELDLNKRLGKINRDINALKSKTLDSIYKQNLFSDIEL